MKNIFLCILLSFMIIGCANNQVNMTKKVSKGNSSFYSESNVSDQLRDMNSSSLNISSDDINISVVVDEKIIAVVLSSAKIGKYALESTNTINTYLLYKKQNYNIEVFDIDNYTSVEDVYSKINEKNITRIISMATNSIEQSKLLDNNISKIYFPLINKNNDKNIDTDNKNLIFGGIDYKKQLKKLIDYSKSKRVVDFYDNSQMGSILHSYTNKNILKYKKEINDYNGQYSYFLKRNKRLVNSTIILNTPIVKSSILLSQMNALDVNIKQVLSTQLNYTPLLLSLTQKADRKNIIVANSIGNLPNDLIEYNQLLGNNVKYSWVNYAVILGTEYFLSDSLEMYDDVKLINNQIEYPIELFRVTKDSFQKIRY